MNETEIVKRLSTLLQMDRDAVKLYTEAGLAMGHADLGIGAERFGEHHARHAEEIERAIRERHQQPKRPTREFESIMRLHMDSISRSRDADETMITMRMAERIMNLEYAEALEMEMPEELRRMLERNLTDEQEHLGAIEQWLEDNVGADVGFHL
ncbi:MAG: ferritin-like domain-containing protein [Coriobacteriia bacterium]|nr:ferritin-like domain-containing protein [Coriobacteriia bacterium]